MPTTTKPHWSFWLIAVLGLLWHLGTVMNFVTQLTPEGIASLPEQYRAIAETRPQWATAALAVAGIGGAIGCALAAAARPRHPVPVGLARRCRHPDDPGPETGQHIVRRLDHRCFRDDPGRHRLSDLVRPAQRRTGLAALASGRERDFTHRPTDPNTTRPLASAQFPHPESPAFFHDEP